LGVHPGGIEGGDSGPQRFGDGVNASLPAA
jgi:hypothetical protein